eukprot:CCRYP_005999-RA/>CCRYP_005999-RA protein AED:0.31 eAED:0.31 QI:0/0/0/1/1/1/3/0/532
MIVGITCDDGTVAIFTQSGSTAHKDTNVLITCQGKPLLIGTRGAHGRYRIPLSQNKGRWQPWHPSKKARHTLHQANRVYDLPTTEQAIRWMHAVCSYPVKSTWLKVDQAGNFIGWPLLTVRNIQKYFPKTVETPKGHLNQSRKNVRSTKQKRIPLDTFQSPQHEGCKLRDVYTHLYDTPATPSFPTKQANSPTAHWPATSISWRLSQQTRPCNKISNAMKTLITNTYKMTYELVPPGCHRRNAAEVVIRNFKSHLLCILTGVADDFPMTLWDKLLPQAEVTINLLRQSNATPTVSAYAHLNGAFDYNKMPLAPMGCRVQAVFACVAALKGITAPTKDITNLKALLDRTASTSPTPTKSHTAVGVPRVRALSNPPSLPRVPPTNDSASSRVTRSMTNQLNQLPIAPVAISTPRLATKLKRCKPTKSAVVPDSAPACNTHSHTTAKAKLLAAPATNTHSKRISRIPKPIPILSKCMKRVNTEVHRALAVMDQNTGKLLNYQALLRHPAYHDDWTKSSANEFGCLEAWPTASEAG